MRFMVMVRATGRSEAGAIPEMRRCTEALARAGVLLAAEGLHPSANGVRVWCSGTERTVTDGPFDTRELVAGFWLLQVRSKEEAIEWVRRCPPPSFDGQAEIEIRQVWEDR